MNTRQRRVVLSRAACCETLEPRQLLAVISGSSGNDSIVISASGSSTLINVNGNVTSTGDSLITINAGDGNDTFNVQSTRSGTTINAFGDAGNDTLTNSSVRDLDLVYRADFRFDGGAGGTDSVIAHNGQDSTTAANMDLHPNGIVENQAAFVLQYTNLEHLDYTDSDGPTRIGFMNMNNGDSPGTDIRLVIHGGDGNDVIVNMDSLPPFDVGYWPFSVGAAGAFVDGGPGTDHLFINNGLDVGALYTFDNATIEVDTIFSDSGPLSYASIESIDLETSSDASADAIRLISKPSTTSLHLDTRDGNDTIDIGDGDLDSNGWALTTILAGNGQDQLVIDDVLDTSQDGTSSTYNFNNGSMAKGSQTIFYSGVESQTLDAADAIFVGFNTTPIVNLNATDSLMISTGLNGGANRELSVNAPNGFGGLPANVTVSVAGTPGVADVLTVNDQAAGGVANIYELRNNQLLKSSTGQVIQYSGLKTMTLGTSDVFDSVAVTGTPAGMSVTVNGNAGNDAFFLGAGNIDEDLLGSVKINGNAGSNTAVINNATDTTFENLLFSVATFLDGQAHTFTSLAKLTINCGPGGSNFEMGSTNFQTDINGGSGNDTFLVGAGDIDANYFPGEAMAMKIDGQGGTDSITIDDRFDTNLDSYIFERPALLDRLRKVDGANSYYFDWANIEQTTLQASNAATTTFTSSSIIVNNLQSPLRINGNIGNDSIVIEDAAAPVTVQTGLGDFDALTVNGDGGAGDTPVTVIIEQSDDIEDLQVFDGGTVRVGQNAVLVKTRNRPTLPGGLTLNGVLDLAGGSFISRAGGQIADFQFRQQLVRGRNGGGWNGLNSPTQGGAINSSLAASSPLSDGVGYGLGSEVAPTSVGGFSIAAGDTLLRYTLDGDADLNLAVNSDDFNRLSANFGLANRIWTQGDFNYDNLANSDDFNALSVNFGQSAAASSFFSGRLIGSARIFGNQPIALEELA